MFYCVIYIYRFILTFHNAEFESKVNRLVGAKLRSIGHFGE